MNSCQFRKHYKDRDTQSIPLCFPQQGRCEKSFNIFEACSHQEIKVWVHPAVQLTLFHKKKSQNSISSFQEGLAYSENISRYITKYLPEISTFLIENCPSVLQITEGCPTYFLLQVIL